MKKKIIIAAVVLVLLLAVGILAWRHTTLLEEIPEEFWVDNHSMTYLPSVPYLVAGVEVEGPILNSFYITDEELKEVASDVELWQINELRESISSIYPIYSSFLLKTKTEGKEYVLLIDNSGYIKCVEHTVVTRETGDVIAFSVGDWYWDGGKLFSFLLDKYVRLSSILPESAWGTVEWIHYDAEERCIDAQGTCETEEAYELLQVAIEISTTSEIAQGYDYFTLAVSNAEWDPNVEYLITVNEIGEVHFQLQNENDQNEVFEVLDAYYEIDPGVFQRLEEMLLPSAE